MNKTSIRLKNIRKKVINRDGLICCYCGEVLTLKEVTMEHIVPDSKKGTFNTTNLTVSCSTCNNKRGDKPFFIYCLNFNWPAVKIKKYRKLYFDNLKIKTLNIAKEVCLKTDEAVPSSLIQEACKILKIKKVDFSDYKLDINFDEICSRKKIKYYFECLIKTIESDTL